MSIKSVKETRNELIVTFIHKNYMVKDGGTEKFAAGISRLIQDKGYSHLCFFPFVKNNKSVTGKEIIGILYNDRFVGISDSEKMEQIVHYYLKKHNLALNCFHVQHLKYHNLNDVFATINSFSVKVYVFAHDFFLICHSQHFIESSGGFCGVGDPSKDKCKTCTYFKEAEEHHKTIKSILISINDRIGSIICPSEFVKKVLESSFPFISDKIIVRPHLLFFGKNDCLEDIDNIRFAYLGKRRMEKGYDQWKFILQSLKKSNIEGYKYYYLGANTLDENDVENIYVSVVSQGSDAMRDAIASSGINCALLWTQCPETYSYVYYELLMSGVYILTNMISGNIYDEVINKHNGRAFLNIEECLSWLKKPELVKKEINEYRKNYSVPLDYRINSDIDMCISRNSEFEDDTYESFNYIRPLLTLLYKLKYGV